MFGLITRILAMVMALLDGGSTYKERERKFWYPYADIFTEKLSEVNFIGILPRYCSLGEACVSMNESARPEMT